MTKPTPVTTARGFVITLRPVVSMVAIPWAAGMAILAAALYGDFQGPMFSDFEFYLRLSLIITATFLGVAGGYALNDYFDHEIDRASPARVDKAANHGIGRRTILAYALILGIPSMSIWLYLGLRSLLVAFMLFLCILVYSAWGKKSTPFSNLFVVAAVALTPIAIFYVFTTQLTLAAVLLAAVNLVFEPGFTWSGVCKDVEGDRKLAVPTLPLRYGIPATSKLVLASWLLVLPLSLALFIYTDLGAIYLAGAMGAGLWLVALALRFIRKPTSAIGGSTFIGSTLWLWAFSLALVLDVVLLF
jgi:4-hydroxybenzoate polyprenyltransferase